MTYTPTITYMIAYAKDTKLMSYLENLLNEGRMTGEVSLNAIAVIEDVLIMLDESIRRLDKCMDQLEAWEKYYHYEQRFKDIDINAALLAEKIYNCVIRNGCLPPAS